MLLPGLPNLLQKTNMSLTLNKLIGESMRSQTSCCVRLLRLIVFLYSPIALTQDFDSELKALAGNLATKIEGANVRSVTVLDFTDLQGVPTELGRFLAQELSNKLVDAANTVSVVDRANVQFLLRENKLSIEGLINPETRKKLGNLIGVDALVVGTTTPVDDRFRLSARLTSVDTGRILGSHTVTLSASDELSQFYRRGVSGAAINRLAKNSLLFPLTHR